MLKISLCLFLIGIAGSIDCTFDYSSDSRCGAKQNYVENVKSSATALCREAKIEKKAANNADFVFTYKNGTGTGFSYGDGGLVAAASAINFPGVIGNKVAMTVLYLKPCGMNLPHIHPRASTISYVAKGQVRCGFWTENVGEFHSFILNEGQGIAFGPGALHFEENVGCSDAVLVAAFNDENPGTAQLTEGIKSMPLDIMAATLNIKSGKVDDFDQQRKKYPKTPAYGTDACYKKCKINKDGTKLG